MKSTKWDKQVFRRKAEAHKTFKDVVKLQIVIKWVNESVTLLIYFRAFRVFRGLAAFLGW